ncbi:MAG: DUF3575 domain-containing protein [Candidatus Cryptobacteroides sp.]
MMRPGTALTTLLLLAALCCGQRSFAQQFSIRSNALATGVMQTPDFGVEMTAGEHSSVALSVAGHYKPYGIDSKVITVQPQYRFWFSGRPLNREYVGVAALYAGYDIRLKDNIYNGNAVGAGITGGYVLSMGKRWGIEFSGGLALMLFNQKRYNSSDSYEEFYSGNTDWANSKGYCLMPFNIGVTFIYIIK